MAAVALETRTTGSLLPQGSWAEIQGGVAAPVGFQAAGIYAGLRAGTKPDLALVHCDGDAVCAGTFTKNVMAAAPVLYCKRILAISNKARAVLINAGQANAATGDAGYRDTVECSEALAKLIRTEGNKVLVQSTGVIGHRIKKDALLRSLPTLVRSLSATPEAGDAAALAITTTDLVSKRVAIETMVGGRIVKIGGMAKGSGMIHPNMATMLGVVTCDARVTGDVWNQMIRTAVNRSFNRITVDGDTSTNDAVIALASGRSDGRLVDDIEHDDGHQLQAALDAVLEALAKSIASDGEGATCLIEVDVRGADDETSAGIVARSIAGSSLTKAAVHGRDPNWGRIACAAGYAGIDFDPCKLQIKLGDIVLMDRGQPLTFDRSAASAYLRAQGEVHGTVAIDVSIGDGCGRAKAWGCDLSYDYVKINAEYTT